MEPVPLTQSIVFLNMPEDTERANMGVGWLLRKEHHAFVLQSQLHDIYYNATQTRSRADGNLGYCYFVLPHKISPFFGGTIGYCNFKQWNKKHVYQRFHTAKITPTLGVLLQENSRYCAIVQCNWDVIHVFHTTGSFNPCWISSPTISIGLGYNL